MNWMVTTIIVPSDGSTAAEPQLASARALARATGARIVVAHVNELVRGHLGAHSVHACEDQLESNVRRQVKELQTAGYGQSSRSWPPPRRFPVRLPISPASVVPISSSPARSDLGRCRDRSAVFHDASSGSPRARFSSCPDAPDRPCMIRAHVFLR